MTVGGLIGCLCGLCTGIFGLIVLVSNLRNLSTLGNALGIVFITGVLPTVIGITLFLVGRTLWNPRAVPVLAWTKRSKR
jgi:hypothetical protein